MSIKKLFVMFVLLTFVSATNAFADERDVKYQDVFYPNGMPVKSGLPTEYELYDELQIPDTDQIVVLFSERMVSGIEGSDSNYSVFISILQSANNVISIKYLNEITDYLILSSMKEKGYFYGMGGVLNFMRISDDAIGVALGMGSYFSGTGGDTSSSDIFFLLKNDELVPILELLGNTFGGSAGGEFSRFVYTFIYLADVDSDGLTDIITQEYEYEDNAIDDIYIRELSPDLNVYKYNSTEERYELSGQITSLPADAVLLNPDTAPDVDALAEEGVE